jgi:hypothetical protein
MCDQTIAAVVICALVYESTKKALNSALEACSVQCNRLSSVSAETCLHHLQYTRGRDVAEIERRWKYRTVR